MTRSFGLSGYFAIGCCLLAALTVVLWLTTDAADDWLPNAGTGLVTVAITVLVVERIVQHENRQRLRPRIDSTLDRLAGRLQFSLLVVATDYVETHVETFKALPSDGHELIEHWVEGSKNEDRERDPFYDSRCLLAKELSDLISDLKEIRANDRDVIEPDLVFEIDEFVTVAEGSLHWLDKLESAGIALSDAVEYLDDLISTVERYARRSIALGDFWATRLNARMLPTFEP